MVALNEKGTMTRRIASRVEYLDLLAERLRTF
jgi:hypothetical protein